MPTDLVNDRVNELYRGEVFKLQTQIACRDRIHWMCSQVVGNDVLDVGCSQGITSLLLGREGHHVVGVDIEKTAVEYALSELEKEAEYVQRNVQFQLVGSEPLPFADESFDTVILGEILEHLTRPERLLMEAHRLLRPDGRVVITTPFGVHPHPGHVRTFYLSNFLSLVGQGYHIHAMRVVDGYINCVGVKSLSGGADNADAWSLEKLLVLSESAFMAKEQRHWEDLDNTKRQRDSLRKDAAKVKDEMSTLEQSAAESAQRLKRVERAAKRQHVTALRAVNHLRDFAAKYTDRLDLSFLADRAASTVARMDEDQSVDLALGFLPEMVREAVRTCDKNLKQLTAAHQAQMNEIEQAGRKQIDTLNQEHATALARLTKQHEESARELRTKLERQLAETQRERDRLLNQLGTMQSQMAALQEQSAKLETQLKQDQHELAEAKRERDRLLNQLGTMQSQMAALQEQSAKLKDEMSTLEQSAAESAHRLKRAERAAKRQHVTALRVVNHLRDFAAKYTGRLDLSFLADRAASTVARMDEDQSVDLALGFLPEMVREAVRTCDKNLKQLTAEHQAQMAALQEQSAKLETQLKQDQHELARMAQQCGEWGSVRETLTARGEKLQNRLNEVLGQRDRLRTESVALRQKLARLAETCTHLRQAISREKARTESLQRKCGVWAAHLDDLTHSVRWRIGDAAVEASRSPFSIFRLPTRLIRLYAEGRRRKHARHNGDSGFNGHDTSASHTTHPLASTARVLSLDDTNGGVTPRRDMNVACILDEFSLTCFRPEARLFELTPEEWKAQIEASRPAFLFVESAWRGCDDKWRHLVTCTRRQGDGPLREVVEFCRQRDIPTVFWNKEDPANFEHFIDTAAWFDVVFTTDSDCLERYRRAAGHDRCFALPFAAQEQIHHPIGRRGGELGRIAFAGTWYSQKHDGRREDAELVLEPALDLGLHIYDRMHTYTGPGWQNYQWPEAYQPAIRGGLSYEEMLEAYRKYHIFLNVNSVRKSPTMCARRVFEILACGTNVVSAYSPALENLIGADSVFLSRSREETRGHLQRLLADEALRNRTSVRAIRRIMASHTYIHRFARILEAVGVIEEVSDPTLACLMTVRNAEELAAARQFLDAQTYLGLEPIWLIGEGSLKANCSGRAEEFRDEAGWLAAVDRALRSSTADLVLRWTPETPQGGEWVEDLARAFRYFDGDGAGKPMDEPADKLIFRRTDRLPLATTMLRKSAVGKLGTGALVSEEAFGEACRAGRADLLATDTVGIKQTAPAVV